MHLRKHKNVYHIHYQENGRTLSKSTKCTKKSEALQYLTNFSKVLEEEAQRGYKSISLRTAITNFLKFSEIMHTLKTYKAYRNTFHHFVKYFGDNTRLDQLPKSKMEEYLFFRIKKASVYQSRKDYINLKCFFNKMVSDEYLKVNPLKEVKRPKIPEKMPLFFTEEEYQQLLGVIPPGNFRNLVELALNTGLRQGEICNLQWSNIDIKNRLLMLDNQVSITKSKRIRPVPLNIRALQILNEMDALKSGAKVFSYSGNYVSYKFKQYIKKTTLNQKLHFHSLRHSYASWLVQKGVSIYVIKELLGHRDVSTTQIYANVKADNLHSAVSFLD